MRLFARTMSSPRLPRNRQLRGGERRSSEEGGEGGRKNISDLARKHSHLLLHRLTWAAERGRKSLKKGRKKEEEEDSLHNLEWQATFLLSQYKLLLPTFSLVWKERGKKRKKSWGGKKKGRRKTRSLDLTKISDIVLLPRPRPHHARKRGEGKKRTEGKKEGKKQKASTSTHFNPKRHFLLHRHAWK